MQIILTEFEASEILLPLCNFDADELGIALAEVLIAHGVFTADEIGEIETDHNGITAHMNDDREIKLELVSSGSKLYAVQIDE